MILIVKNGAVIATHEDRQRDEVAGAYDSAEIMWYYGPLDVQPGDVLPGEAKAFPRSVPMAGMRKALVGVGMLGTVQALLDAMPGDEGAKARIDWGFQPTVARDNALVLYVQQQAGWTDAQVDALFAAANAEA